MITNQRVFRFKHKVEAFKKAQNLFPDEGREKVSGFVLLVGSGPQVVEAGQDREKAIAKAINILEENDTLVFVSKLQSRVGSSFVTKDQLILSRKYEG